MFYKFASLALASSFLPSLVSGHGFLTSPRSRNWVAHDDVNKCSGSGCPRPEYCHHCLNGNDGVCGKTSGGNSYETDVWLDRDGQPMPWVSQATYDAGQLIVVNSEMSTHHGGHQVIAYCVIGETDCSTPDDFPKTNRLEFVQDLTEGGVAMPRDPLHPDRGYYSQWGSQTKFSFVYKLPDNVHGERVLLQWRYITANSCLPPDYATYFNANSQIPRSYWKGENMAACEEPYPNDGSRSSVHPEQFFNCAEVTVLTSGTAPPTLSLSPTNAPVIGGPPSCLREYEDCVYSPSTCCEGFKCTQVDDMGNSKCLDICKGSNQRRPTNPPTPPTFASPTMKPTMKPTLPTGGPPSPTPPTSEPGTGCCSRDLGTCTHLDNSFCNADKENCEGPCGKVWLSDGDISATCLPLWEQGCVTDSDCCLWSHCAADGSCAHDGTWKPPVGFTNSPTSRVTPEPTNRPSTKPTNNPTTSAPTTTPSEGSNPPTFSTCTICDDRETSWQIKNGVGCATDTVRIEKNCNKDVKWTNKGYCRLSCYNAGNGYPGDVCCNDRPTNPPTLSQQQPTYLPTYPPTSTPSEGSNPPTFPTCTICDDRETSWQIQNGFDCATDTVRMDKKCNKDAKWTDKGFCRLSCYNVGNGYPGDVCCDARPTTYTPTSTPPTKSPPSPPTSEIIWDQDGGLVMTHYWDCSGQSCDATTLSPWDSSKYRSASGYQPQNPSNFGGSVYGEKMWLTGAIMNIDMGPSDSCCGDTDDGSGGCGQCVLVQNPDAINSDWTALIMKKNTCGSCVSGPHIDVNVPGFDVLQYSLANTCGEPGTGLTKQQSSVVGQWYNNYANTKQAQALCNELPSVYQEGCRLFTDWGWTTGKPQNVRFKVVPCPQAFKDHISSMFDSNGVTAAGIP